MDCQVQTLRQFSQGPWTVRGAMSNRDKSPRICYAIIADLRTISIENALRERTMLVHRSTRIQVNNTAMHQKVQEKAYLRVSHPRRVISGLKVQVREVRMELRIRILRVKVRSKHAQAQGQRKNGMKKIQKTLLRSMAMRSSYLNTKNKTMVLQMMPTMSRKNSMARSMVEVLRTVKKSTKHPPRSMSRWLRPS